MYHSAWERQEEDSVDVRSLRELLSVEKPEWTDETCIVCGAEPRVKALALVEASSPYMPSQIHLVAWCDRDLCIKDRLDTHHLVLP
jgi:hypothetical protein